MEESVLPLVCGLLNGDGGWIVIGANAKREVIDISTEGLKSRIQLDMVSTINPLPLVYAAEEKAEGKPVVLITVIKGVLSPYTYRNKCYIIRDGEAVIPSANEMNWLLRNMRGSKISWELSPCVAAEEEQIDFARIRKVMEHGHANKRLHPELETIFLLTESELVGVSSSVVRDIYKNGGDITKFVPKEVKLP